MSGVLAQRFTFHKCDPQPKKEFGVGVVELCYLPHHLRPNRYCTIVIMWRVPRVLQWRVLTETKADMCNNRPTKPL